MFSRLILSLGLIAGLSPAVANAAERPVVVELFTSQGCSSCPPANAYLNEISRSRRGAARARLPRYLLGSSRLEGPVLDGSGDEPAGSFMAAALAAGSYTPEMVVDGAASAVGSNRGEIGSAIEKAKRNGQTAAAINVTKNGDQVSIEVGAGSGQGRILLIGFDREHTTAIGRGENSGRTLTEANVVRSFRAVGQWSGAAVRLNERFPQGQDVAVVLEAADGRIIGAGRLATGGST